VLVLVDKNYRFLTDVEETICQFEALRKIGQMGFTEGSVRTITVVMTSRYDFDIISSRWRLFLDIGDS
jgi:hypothetical protein